MNDYRQDVRERFNVRACFYPQDMPTSRAMDLAHPVTQNMSQQYRQQRAIDGDKSPDLNPIPLNSAPTTGAIRPTAGSARDRLFSL